MSPVFRAPLPPIRKRPEEQLLISGFVGMNSTTHPSLLFENQPSVLYNAYFQDGILTKRNGTATIGGYLTAKHAERFTATTYRDATATTGSWDTTNQYGALKINSTAQVDTSTSTNPTGFSKDRHTVLASNGTIIITYQDGAGIKTRMSTDQGATWVKPSDSTAGEDTITTDTNAYWSICIDSSDHIHVTYQSDDADSKIHYRKLTFSTPNWSIGDEATVATPASGNDYTYPSIGITTAGTIWVAYSRYITLGSVYCFASYSTNGTDWTQTTVFNDDYGWFISPVIVVSGNSVWCFFKQIHLSTGFSWLYFYKYSTSWDSKASIGFRDTPYLTRFHDFSVTAASATAIWFVYGGNDGIQACKYNGNTTLSNLSTLSAIANDSQPVISTDGTYLWAVWNRYEAANQYELTYKLHNGTSWSTSSTDITSANSNYQSPSLSETLNSQTIFPIIWRGAASSPYDVKARVVQFSGVVQSTGYDSGAGSQTYTASYSSSVNATYDTLALTYADCTTVGGTYSAFTSDISTLNKQFIKFKGTLTTKRLEAVPYFDNVEITYGGAKIVGLHTFTRDDGDISQLAIAASSIYKYLSADDTWMEIKTGLTANLKTQAAALNDMLLITNGTDAVMRYNGKITEGTLAVVNGDATVEGTGTHWNTASNANKLVAGGKIKLPDDNWYTISSITDDDTLEISVVYPGVNASGETYEAHAIIDLEGSPPTGTMIETHKNFVFIAGNSTYPNRLFYSAILDADSWTVATDFININPSDGQKITAIKSFRDLLTISKYDTAFTNGSIHALAGAAADEFSVRPITSTYGAVNPASLVVTPNALYFLDAKAKIIKTDLVTFVEIGQPIQNILDSVNFSYLQNACGMYYDEKVFFAVPYSSSVTNNYLLMFDTKFSPAQGWSIHTGLNPGVFSTYTPTAAPYLYYGDQTANSAVFRWDTGNSDNGQAINFQMETKEFSFDNYFLDKRIKYLSLLGEPTSSNAITAYYALNGSSSYTALDETLATTGSEDVFKRWNLPGITASTIKFKLVENSTGAAPKIVKMGITSVPKSMRTD